MLRMGPCQPISLDFAVTLWTAGERAGPRAQPDGETSFMAAIATSTSSIPL